MSKLFEAEDVVAPVRMKQVNVVETPKEYVGDVTTELVSTKEVNFTDKMFDNVREIMSHEADLSKKVYFKDNSFGCKGVYSLDDSVFCPSHLVLIGPGFDRKYYAQLKNVLLGETLDERKMIELITIYSKISHGQYPLHLKSKKYTRLLPKMTVMLNAFFNEYKSIIRSMYTMFNSNVQTRNDELLVTKEKK